MYRIVFFGTPKIASVCLKALIDSKNEIVGVVSQPDRLVDKNKKVIFSEVKQVAIENNLFLMQPEKVSEAKQKIKDLKPDIIITCAYGNLIPSSILDIPKFKCVNFHTSLLPKYRGGAPIHHAILNMEKETGLTIMYMDKGMDNGDIIKQFPVIITENTTYSELYEILSKLIYEKCLENIDYLCTTHVYSVKQNENLVSFAPIIKRENEKINWNSNAINIKYFVNALYSIPMAYTTLDELNIKITKIKLTTTPSNAKPGTIINVSKSGVEVCCSDYNILITDFIIPGKKEINITSYINGNKIFVIGKKFI